MFLDFGLLLFLDGCGIGIEYHRGWVSKKKKTAATHITGWRGECCFYLWIASKRKAPHLVFLDLGTLSFLFQQRTGGRGGRGGQREEGVASNGMVSTAEGDIGHVSSSKAKSR